MMGKKYFFINLLFLVLFSQLGFSQSKSAVGVATGNWISLMKGDKFDPNDDQQSVADTDFVGNTAHAMVETQKETINFTDGLTDDVYYFRVRMGQSIASTSFYLGIDVSGDLIADLFIEANMKSQTPYVSFHKRDVSKTGLSPSQTAWLNGTKNNEFFLDARNAHILTYTAGTDIDGGNSGTDSWIEFGFTEESLKKYVLNNFGVVITGNSVIALYGFTSTSQTSNGDIAGVNDKLSGVLDKSWEELGVIVNGTLDNIASGEILVPAVNTLSTTDTTPTITGSWGGEMLGDDHLIITINGITYSEEIYINNTNWSVTILYPEMLSGTYEVVATTTRTSNNNVRTDTTSNELIIVGSTELTTVTSANDGGLESNGDLASLIAKRNFNRIKSNSFANEKEVQKKFIPTSFFLKKTSSGIDFSALIPNTGILGVETSFVSSPTDLIEITNAKEVYSVDYYQGNNRVAAVLATSTTGAVYSHSKAICDRLNNSSLENIVTINLNGYEVILVEIKRANGLTEYAVNFSIQQLTTANVLHSYWNIEQYPAGDYLNFQVWGSSTAQVCHIAKTIISKIQQQKALTAEVVSNRIPTVFVKKGFYKNGKLNMAIINKSRAFNLTFIGNKKTTELAATAIVSQNLILTGAYEQNIVLDLGGLFDIGLSIIGDKSKQLDGLYLADGPWGLDYLKTETKISSFLIDNTLNTNITNDQYAIERNTTVTGDVYGTLNVFRNILPGDLLFDASLYSMVGFTIQNSLPVEVVLITENTTDWNDRLRFQLPANATAVEMNVLFNNFANQKGQKYTNEKIKGLVFSVQGNYSAFRPFEISVSQLAFKNTSSLSTVGFSNKFSKSMYSYPNPCQFSTTLVLPQITESARVEVADLTGRILIAKSYKTVSSNNEIQVALDNLSKGAYLFIVTTKENEKLQTKFIIE
ncbi:T9SS type A sorting domain-containing protein [Flavobacterium sp. LS1P3]|uniref:T9SS type A sorting domain-containing protein n=1 Tax=Flavobacterium sp. LS1P3 TaxID=3401720 RepID=UPI003AB10754